MHALALRYDNFWASAGVHPDNEGVREPDVDDLLRLAALPRVVAIGETGLDYYRLERPQRRADGMAARALSRPHPRGACLRAAAGGAHAQRQPDTLDMLREEGGGAVQRRVPLLHRNPGGGRAALDLGFHISFSGILTFKNAEALREVARLVPLDRCLIETDSPYLAPVPYRGKTNQPAYVAHVAAQLAQLKDCSIERLAEATSRNFARLFARTNATTEQDK